MGDKLKRVSVAIRYATTGGLSAISTHDNKEADPAHVAESALYELVRIMAVNGNEVMALATVREAVNNVRRDRGRKPLPDLTRDEKADMVLAGFGAAAEDGPPETKHHGRFA